MTRVAHRSCGSLRAEATGEPALLGYTSLAQFAKPVPLRLKRISRELQLNRSLAAADWRRRKLLLWEV
jgi:hypothetical protein